MLASNMVDANGLLTWSSVAKFPRPSGHVCSSKMVFLMSRFQREGLLLPLARPASGIEHCQLKFRTRCPTHREVASGTSSPFAAQAGGKCLIDNSNV
jgi:hypothetical protein